jgi:hypothetical protein
MVKGIELTRNDDAGGRRVLLSLSQLAFDALVGEEGNRSAPMGLEGAVRSYLGDRETDRPAWAYPGFLRGSESQKEVEVELEVPADLWDAFTAEAARQEVSVEQLAEHAAFYFAADLDAGRVTQRILDDFGSTESGGGDS